MRMIAKSRWVVFTVFSLGLLGYSQVVSATITLPLRSKKGMVVSAHPLASDTGIRILSQGGNAVDAAVATTLAISVVEPFSAGIGGGGFLLMRLQKTGEIKALDFRERAPLQATRNMYLDAQGKVRPGASVNGYLAVGTPGTVAGMYEVQRRYGKLPWAEVVKPAIALAEDGFVLSQKPTWRSIQVYESRKQAILSNPAAREIFTRNGEFYQPGERLVQRDLARTLKIIAQNPRSFYTGSIAQAIAADMAKNDGLITLADLKAYKPIWRIPICGNFRQAKICSMPPPSSGGILLLQMLNIIGNTDLKSWGWHHPYVLHLLTEAMKITYSDRSQYLGDPDFIKIPVQQLLSSGYANKRRAEIHLYKATPSTQVKPIAPEILQRFGEGKIPHRMYANRYESPETSHLNVIDEERNAVSLTFTVNYGFGSGVVASGTGILLNDEMDDFASAPGVANVFGLVGSEANAIAPLKTPLSSMTPTIVTENGHLRMVVGAPGGSTIITQVLQVILNVLVYDMDTGAAVSVPRIHHQWLPDELRLESWGFDHLTVQDLRRRGHNVKEISPWGNVNAIAITQDGNLEGAADPRGEGSARGY
ncbi:gamma-glutamyltransferase [Nostoc sp. TCL26-01]|uniref:gamma-glutamyltransferase n=1 Tax=Nostoc sp. TCL26-01 TaxID=2576904 RepID=UPI0015BF1C1A|nr:gamma-glutamyltransferase [Nostoc sp. TCL26-01]